MGKHHFTAPTRDKSEVEIPILKFISAQAKIIFSNVDSRLFPVCAVPGDNKWATELSAGRALKLFQIQVFVRFDRFEAKCHFKSSVSSDAANCV